MGESPVFSVIVPLFNKRDYVGRTLDSILNQTVQDVEILVVDGGSTDGSVEIVEAVRDLRVRLMRQSGNGLCQARNEGVAASRSGLLAFIDADDEWTPSHLANILKAKERYPHCKAYATNYVIVQPDGSLSYPEFPGLQPKDGLCLIKNYFTASEKFSILSCSSIALTRETFDRLGGFPETEVVKHEFCLFAGIGLNGEIGFCMEPSFIYHMDAENRWLQHVHKMRSDLKDCNVVLIKLLDDALASRAFRNKHVTIEDVREYRKKVRFWRACDLVRIGRPGKGRLAALKSLATREYFWPSVKLIVQSFVSR